MPLCIQELGWPGANQNGRQKDPQERQREGLQNTGEGRIGNDGGWGFGLHDVWLLEPGRCWIL